ncbi:MAG: pyridoxamine 5'-phosphate oxidase family protein [Eubacteriales bacterium]|nr:pyridoxamine 5'-phosphate oxidase family protein [Eubacteriales bacterium]
MHGRAAGEKLDNILRDGRVCFTVYEAQGLSYEEDGPYACGVNTLFESVVIKGRAALVADEAEKRRILYALTEKYVPSFAKKEMPEASVARTAVIEITPDSVTGKFFPGRGK